MDIDRPRRAARTARTVLLSLALCLAGASFVALPATSAWADSKADEAKRDEWVQKYNDLRAHHAQLEADLAQARADYSRGRSSKHLRGEGKAGLIEEIDRLEKELATAQQELQDFPDEARRQGALPGWFRDLDAPAAQADGGVASDDANDGGRHGLGRSQPTDRSASSRRIGSRPSEPEPESGAQADDDAGSGSLFDRRAKRRESRRLD